MRMIKTMLAGAAGIAALAAAAPASAQYYQSYGYSQPYRYAQPYGYSAYGANTAMAQQQCTAAVQSRLYNRTSLGQHPRQPRRHSAEPGPRCRHHQHPAA